VYKPRATSTTRTIFRLKTNQSNAYEESHYNIIIQFIKEIITEEQTYCINSFQHATSG